MKANCPAPDFRKKISTSGGRRPLARHPARAKKSAVRRGLAERPVAGRSDPFHATGHRWFPEIRGKEEFLQAIGLRRRQTVTARHPVFSTEIIKVHPKRPGRTLQHRFDIRRRQAAGKRFDDDIRDVGVDPFGRPVTDRHASMHLQEACGSASGYNRAKAHKSSIHKRTFSSCSATSCRARRQSRPRHRSCRLRCKNIPRGFHPAP